MTPAFFWVHGSAWLGMASNTLISSEGAAVVLRTFHLTSGYGGKGHLKYKAPFGGCVHASGLCHLCT